MTESTNEQSAEVKEDRSRSLPSPVFSYTLNSNTSFRVRFVVLSLFFGTSKRTLIPAGVWFKLTERGSFCPVSADTEREALDY